MAVCDGFRIDRPATTITRPSPASEQRNTHVGVCANPAMTLSARVGRASAQQPRQPRRASAASPHQASHAGPARRVRTKQARDRNKSDEQCTCPEEDGNVAVERRWRSHRSAHDEQEYGEVHRPGEVAKAEFETCIAAMGGTMRPWSR